MGGGGGKKGWHGRDDEMHECHKVWPWLSKKKFEQTWGEVKKHRWGTQKSSRGHCNGPVADQVSELLSPTDYFFDCTFVVQS